MMFSWLKINHSIRILAKEREDSKATTAACLSEAPVGGMGIAMETAKHTRMYPRRRVGSLDFIFRLCTTVITPPGIAYLYCV